jgi:hypothetical protein
MNKKGLKEDQEFDQGSAGLSGEAFMWSGQGGQRPIYSGSVRHIHGHKAQK